MNYTNLISSVNNFVSSVNYVNLVSSVNNVILVSSVNNVKLVSRMNNANLVLSVNIANLASSVNNANHVSSVNVNPVSSVNRDFFFFFFFAILGRGPSAFLIADCRLSPLSEVFDLSSALHFSARFFRLIAHISRNHKQFCLYATT